MTGRSDFWRDSDDALSIEGGGHQSLSIAYQHGIQTESTAERYLHSVL